MNPHICMSPCIAPPQTQDCFPAVAHHADGYCYQVLDYCAYPSALNLAFERRVVFTQAFLTHDAEDVVCEYADHE